MVLSDNITYRILSMQEVVPPQKKKEKTISFQELLMES